jgi:hypothetical protein
MEFAREVIVVERHSANPSEDGGMVWPSFEFEASFLSLARLECFDTIRVDAHVNPGVDNSRTVVALLA